MSTFTYSLIENGYEYETGTVQASSAEEALDLAAAKARPAARQAYGPDDDSTIHITHGVIVTDGEGFTLKDTVTFEVTA